VPTLEPVEKRLELFGGHAVEKRPHILCQTPTPL
jgi:hypothetical protein